MKSERAVQLLHDRIIAVILGETPLRPDAREREALSLQAGPLCWMLGHDHIHHFRANMLSMLLDLMDAGVVLVRDCEDDDEQMQAICLGAMGATANIFSRILLDRPPEVSP